MSNMLTCPVAGITELILDTVAGNAVLRATPEVSDIQVTADSLDATRPPELLVEGDKVRLVGGSATAVTLPEGVTMTVAEILGDARVHGFDVGVRLRSVQGDLRLGPMGGNVAVEHLHAELRAEAVSSLKLGQCDGDVRFSSGGDLEMELVGGDLRVTRANNVRGVRFHGDVWCENLSGTVKLEEVNGDVRLSDVEGQVVLGQVAGDLRVASARGGLTVGHVHGDAMLAGPLSHSEDYILSTDGDAQVRIARGDDVRLVARAAGRIRANLPLTPTSDGTPTYSATIGSGKVRVAVSSGGDLRIEAADGEEVHDARERKRGSGSDLFSDIGNLGERIRQQVTASLAAAGINPDTGEVNLGRNRHARGAFRGFNPHTPPDRPKPPPKSAGPLSDEQLTILKMLEDGRITPEEADALLRALGA